MNNSKALTLKLILGDQLYPLHSWFKTVDPQVIFVLMQVKDETQYVLHHAQKILAIFAALEDFAKHLTSLGHRVHWLPIDDPSNRQSITANLDMLIQHHQAHSLHYQQPDEWRLDEQLKSWSIQAPVMVQSVCSEHFLNPRHAVQDFFGDKKHWLMEFFYRHQRKKHHLLMNESGQPEGGQWNFDANNRKPWRHKPPAPKPIDFHHDHTLLWQRIQSAGVQSFGNPSAQTFAWPLNRSQALQQLAHFVEHSLVHFGHFQDAMSKDNWHLFHSMLSFALNTKMLHPLEVLQAVQKAYESGAVEISAAEGFVRQILGWREYVRGFYWAKMPHLTQSNHLQHHRPLPEWFWSGHTQMACLKDAISQSLDKAYAHHIQRLMVIGNFALLAGLNPQALHQWYLGIYIDAFEWVEAPNTLAMSQWADAGQLATKPYVSGANYLQNMSDHCSTCTYKPKDRLGEKACPFNALYWNFFMSHESAFKKNPRLALVYRRLNDMPKSELDLIQTKAKNLLASLALL